MVSLDEEEKQKLSNQRIDYTITQIQESTSDTILIIHNRLHLNINSNLKTQ
jgi:hypothetical protein